jgi:diaminohydroxyphosphoribosylaminopyrimidine deaminase/5-amino-6-(5-phosphoribosylamino)uracil reductase
VNEAFWMRRALELARRARGRTSPNPLVGAVVVREGLLVGEGYHQRAGTPHAEVQALAAAGERARGATVYVTLEPCAHHGRTPPCTEALIAAGVRRVVAAMIDPNPRVAGRGLAALEAAGIATQVGLLENEARQLNETYLHYITTGRPFVVLKWAMTLDGKIATSAGDSRWISNRASRRLGHRLRDEYDAVMVGVGTVLRDDPRLTARLSEFGEVPPEGTERQPLRVVVDSQARTPPTAQVLRPHGGPPTLVAVLDQAPAARRAALREAGAEVLVLPERGGRVDLVALMEALGRREVTSVLVEGGGTLHAGMLAAGLGDKVVAFIAPKIAGGAAAPTPVEGPGVSSLSEAVLLTGLAVRELEGDVVVEGYLVAPCLPGSSKN